MSDFEEKLKEFNLSQNRVTEQSIRDKIELVEYHTIKICGKTMMFCGIKMKNQYVEVGEPSVCVDENNFREEIGKVISYENTFNKLWRLEGYLKQENMMDNFKPDYEYGL